MVVWVLLLFLIRLETVSTVATGNAENESAESAKIFFRFSLIDFGIVVAVPLVTLERGSLMASAVATLVLVVELLLAEILAI